MACGGKDMFLQEGGVDGDATGAVQLHHMPLLE